MPATIESVRKLARTVQDEGALLIAQLNHNGRQHHSTGAAALWAPSAIACPRSRGMPHAMTLAEIKAVAGSLPIVATARIQTPEQAERILAEGKADLIGMSRALVADPEWPLKAQAGRADDIRRCIYTSANSSRGSASTSPT